MLTETATPQHNEIKNQPKQKDPLYVRILMLFFVLIFVASNWLFTLSIFSNIGRNLIDYPKLQIVTTLNHYIYHYPLLIPAIFVLSRLQAVRNIFNDVSAKTKTTLIVLLMALFTFLCYNNALQFICSAVSLLGMIVVHGFFYNRKNDRIVIEKTLPIKKIALQQKIPLVKRLLIKLTFYPSIFVALLSFFISQSFDALHIALFAIFILNMSCINFFVLSKKLKMGFWIFCVLTLCGSIIAYHLHDVALPFVLLYFLAPVITFLLLRAGQNNVWSYLK